VKTVIEEGATVAIDTDAHAPVHMEFLRYGVHTARRGWAEPDDVLNTCEVEGVREFLGL
jgi:DNA polymerase (family 10)